MSRPYPDHHTTISFTCNECGKDAAAGQKLPRLVMTGPRVMWECPHCELVAIRELPPTARQAFAELLDDPLTLDELADVLSDLADDVEFQAAVDYLNQGRL